MSRKNNYVLVGILEDMTEQMHFNNKGSDLYKRVLTIKTEDSQIIYPEIRNSNLKLLELEQIVLKDKVQIFFTFEGSTLQDKKFNNIHIHAIKKL